PLHEHFDVLTDPIREHEASRVFPLFAEGNPLLERVDLEIGGCREELVLRDAEGEEELRLAVEEEGAESEALAGGDEVGEVDVAGQILLARVGEEVPRDAML